MKNKESVTVASIYNGEIIEDWVVEDDENGDPIFVQLIRSRPNPTPNKKPYHELKPTPKQDSILNQQL